MEKTFAMISLGCAKNLVNSEQMLYLLDEAGFTLVPDPEGADLAIVNTCGFIDAAKSEAIDNILQMAALKKEGKLGGLIVTGCLTERYQDSILRELPEIDAVLGVGSFGDIVGAANAVLAGRSVSLFGDKNAPVDEIPRVVSTGPAWAYLRIAEGCNNYCAFCAIPYIRGRYRSRAMENVLAEAKELAAHGVRELIVIAQDITRYGTDLYGRRCLAQLCRELAKIEGVAWIRLHYLYPDQFDDELIDEIAANDKIVKYLDIPIQHINNGILKRMNRRGTGDEIRALFQTLRARIPGLVPEGGAHRARRRVPLLPGGGHPRRKNGARGLRGGPAPCGPAHGAAGAHNGRFLPGLCGQDDPRARGRLRRGEPAVGRPMLRRLPRHRRRGVF